MGLQEIQESTSSSSDEPREGNKEEGGVDLGLARKEKDPSRQGSSSSSAEPVRWFHLRDLDGHLLNCTDINAGELTMIKYQGTIRAVGLGRFKRLVRNLVFTPSGYFDVAKRYSSRGEFNGYDYNWWGRIDELQGLPVVEREDLLAQALELQFGCGNTSRLSLKSFADTSTDLNWGRTSTMRGR